MTDEPTQDPEAKDIAPDPAERVHRWLTAFFAAIMAVEFAVLVYNGERLAPFLVLILILVVTAPILFRERLPVRIPAEFQIVAVIFVFSALFLGEFRDYYNRIWWWDIALHANSGLLLGIVGFLLVYVLNENERVDFYLQPRFLASFAFLFAVSMGAFWEIFEFAMDELFGMNMQKAMLDDPSGLTDTMWDLVMDTLGAAVISVFGWWYSRHPERSFIESWIQKFIETNPNLFRGRLR